MSNTMNINATRWVAEAKNKGATHVLDVVDEFDYTHYPVYVMPGDSLEAVKERYSTNMQRVYATYPVVMKD